jgi:hypothetical protein
MANYKLDDRLERHLTTTYLMEYMDKEILQKYYREPIIRWL